MKGRSIDINMFILTGSNNSFWVLSKLISFFPLSYWGFILNEVVKFHLFLPYLCSGRSIVQSVYVELNVLLALKTRHSLNGQITFYVAVNITLYNRLMTKSQVNFYKPNHTFIPRKMGSRFILVNAVHFKKKWSKKWSTIL